MLKPLIKAIFALALLSLLSACFEERIIVNVNKKGAGTIEHASFNNLDNMMGSLFSGLENAGSEASANEAKYTDAYFADKAAEMGTGVTVQSWRLASNSSGFQGYEAVYDFVDINTLNVATSPVDSDQTARHSTPVDSSALKATHTFSMKNGQLIIHTPEPETEKNQQAVSSQLNQAATQQMLAMMGAMFRGARVSVSINALDPIANTNARHHNDSLVTLMDVRLDELMSNPELFTQAQQYSSLNREEAQALADKIEGIDVDTQAQIIIQF